MTDFFSDSAAIKALLAKHDLEKNLEECEGFVRICNFLPDSAANAVLEAVKKLENWEDADGDDDAANYNDAISHKFRLAELDGCRDDETDAEGGCGEKAEESPLPRKDRYVLRGMAKLLWDMYNPETTIPNFTAACYTKGHHIAPHDDNVLESYTLAEVKRIRTYYSKGCQEKVKSDEENSGCSSDGEGEGEEEELHHRDYDRKLACVYYLNKDWDSQQNGGGFKDLVTQKEYSPEFNSLVIFAVPRMHTVVPVKGDNVKRYSVFGWWLEEREECDDSEVAEPVQVEPPEKKRKV